ncbi:AAA family ATPase [Candidatus Sumerlaeota bacterium]|nr:AAA family ATPase [Candidatus Sumerlaeota bacterium]
MATETSHNPEGQPGSQELRRITVLIVSEDAALRQGAAESFRRMIDVQSSWLQAETISRGYDIALARRPSMLLVDLRSNPKETLRVVQRINEHAHGVKIVGLYNPLDLPEDLEQSDLFLDGVRRGCCDFLRVPISTEEAQQVFDRIVAMTVDAVSHRADALRHGRVISLISGKGGVGKTTIATNLAIALARQAPGEVVIVDASMDLGNVSDYLNVQSTQSIYDAAMARDRLDRDLLISMMSYHEEGRVYVLGHPQKVEQLAVLTDQDITQVLLTLRSAFKYIVVDTLPIFNAISIAVGDLSDIIMVIAESIVPTINGTREVLSKLAQAGYPADRIRLLVNRFDGRHAGNVALNLAVESLQRSIDWVLPFDREMDGCANLGRPCLLSKPRLKIARKIEEIAQELTLGNGSAAAAAKPGRSKVFA